MRAHLLQLSNIWERVQELGDVRENKLAEALELVTATSLLPFTRSVSVSVSLQNVVRICCRRSQLRCNESNTTRPPQSLYCNRQLISESNFMQPHKQPSESEVKCLTFQTHGFKYPQDHRRSPSPLPKKAPHRVMAREPRLGAVHIFTPICGCCAEPLAQSYIRYTDVTCASCPGFPWAHDVSGLSAPTSNLCLREYSDSTNPFISARVVQLTLELY